MIVSEETILTQTSVLFPSRLIFGRILKCFVTAVWTFFISKSESKVTYVYAILCYSIVIFCMLFGELSTNFASLEGGQLHSPDVNHYVFIITSSEGQS